MLENNQYYEQKRIGNILICTSYNRLGDVSTLVPLQSPVEKSTIWATRDLHSASIQPPLSPDDETRLRWERNRLKDYLRVLSAINSCYILALPAPVSQETV